jgi:hypothetical protein
MRNQTIRKRKRIIPHKETIELAQLISCGHVVRMEDEICTKMAWQARSQGRRPKGRLRRTWKEGMQKILKER